MVASTKALPLCNHELMLEGLPRSKEGDFNGFKVPKGTLKSQMVSFIGLLSCSTWYLLRTKLFVSSFD